MEEEEVSGAGGRVLRKRKSNRNLIALQRAGETDRGRADPKRFKRSVSTPSIPSRPHPKQPIVKDIQPGIIGRSKSKPAPLGSASPIIIGCSSSSTDLRRVRFAKRRRKASSGNEGAEKEEVRNARKGLERSTVGAPVQTSVIVGAANMFQGQRIFLVRKGIGGVQFDVLKKHIVDKGGVFEQQVSAATTIVVSKINHQETLKQIGVENLPSRCRLHSLEWLTESIKRKRCLPANELTLLDPMPSNEISSSQAIADKPRSIPHSAAAGEGKSDRTHRLSPDVREMQFLGAESDLHEPLSFQWVPLNEETEAEVDESKEGREEEDEATQEDHELQAELRVQITANQGNVQQQKTTAIPTRADLGLASQRKPEFGVTRKRASTARPDVGQSWLTYEPSDEEEEDKEEGMHAKQDPKAEASGDEELPFSVRFDDSSLELSPSASSSLPSSSDALPPTQSHPGDATATQPPQHPNPLVASNPFFAALFNAPPATKALSDKAPRPKARKPPSTPTAADAQTNNLCPEMTSSSSLSPRADSPEREIFKEFATQDITFTQGLAPSQSPGWSSQDHNSGDSNATNESCGDSPLSSSQLDEPFSVLANPRNKRLNFRRKYFACQQSPGQSPERVNHNQHLTDILEVLQQKSEGTGEKWRAYAYRKAIAVLKSHPHQIATAEQALRLRGIGKSIAEKINEILETGRLRKAEATDEMTEVMKMLSKIWGAGTETVRKWYSQGVRSLEDLSKVKLNRQQQIGFRYYEEFQKRIPREEVKTLEGYVKQAAKSISPQLKVVTCGSYRRGKPDCGDIDCLITHKLHAPVEGLLARILDNLRACNFLTDDLLEGKDGDVYMGVCCLPGGVHRRIDLRMIPRESWPFALLYFTGSDHFNRSMRLWARKNGMSLSEKALQPRYTEDDKGDPIPGLLTEADVFKSLGLEYRPPHEREV